MESQVMLIPVYAELANMHWPIEQRLVNSRLNVETLVLFQLSRANLEDAVTREWCIEVNFSVRCHGDLFSQTVSQRLKVSRR